MLNLWTQKKEEMGWPQPAAKENWDHKSFKFDFNKMTLQNLPSLLLDLWTQPKEMVWSQPAAKENSKLQPRITLDLCCLVKTLEYLFKEIE